LIPTVSQILFVEENRQSHFSRERHGSVGTVVIDQQDFIYDIEWNLAIGLRERSGRVVGGHDDDYLLVIQHGVISFER
jgi:hypothetical protein